MTSLAGGLTPLVTEFMKANPSLMPKDNALKFLSDDGGETYNRCHFWSNFEIGDLNFWRGTAYTKYFDYLDKAGGFYYEVRHTLGFDRIACSLTLPRGSDGAMLQSTALERHFSLAKTRSTSSSM